MFTLFIHFHVYTQNHEDAPCLMIVFKSICVSFRYSVVFSITETIANRIKIHHSSPAQHYNSQSNTSIILILSISNRSRHIVMVHNDAAGRIVAGGVFHDWMFGQARGETIVFVLIKNYKWITCLRPTKDGSWVESILKPERRFSEIKSGRRLLYITFNTWTALYLMYMIN